MRSRLLPALTAFLTVAGGAHAQTAPEAPSVTGPVDWGMNLQTPGSPVAEQIYDFNILLTWIALGISVFVLALLAYACVRFRASRNPNPGVRTHNTTVEILWTAVPVLILVTIAVPSFKLLYYMDRAVEPEMTIKAIGRQWYWSYEYPDNGNFTFDANMVYEEDLQPGQKRLLETDYRVVLPVETDIRVLVTGSDVIHSWAMPSLGIKTDAMPGRVNETWVRIERPGVYYGQCSEICGTNHSFMPITIEALPKDRYQEWVKTAQQEFARADGAGVDVASAGAAEPRP